MSFRLLGIGTAVPEHAVGQDAAAVINAGFATTDPARTRTVRALYRRSGVAKRHSVLLDASGGSQSFYAAAAGPDDQGPQTAERMARYEAEAPMLAEMAVRRALADAATELSALTHLITVSCTGFFAPGLDAALISRLGLPRTVERTHVGFMGCHGALNGLRVATSQAEADPDALVLVASVELCTLHFAYGWDPQLMVANALFADGAAAVVGRAGKGDTSSGESGSRWSVLSSGSYLMPDSEDAMSWRVGDHGFRMTLSAGVPELIGRHLPGWIDEWLGGHGLTVADIGSWAVHPGGPRVLSAVRDALGTTDDAVSVSREILSEYGNMSSATVLFILERLRERGAPRPCVALAFGPGLVVEAALLV
jgi:predicted naringenin-chalcone synthase